MSKRKSSIADSELKSSPETLKDIQKNIEFDKNEKASFNKAAKSLSPSPSLSPLKEPNFH